MNLSQALIQRLETIFLRTIITNYNPEAVVIISTHLIADVESVLDDVIFIKDSEIVVLRLLKVCVRRRVKALINCSGEVFKC